MSEKAPIDVFPPGDFIREEIEERGWNQEVLAEVLGLSRRLVSEIITGRRSISVTTAQALGDAFGTGPNVWLNLESAYRLSQVRARDESVARRAKLYGMGPLREIIKRGWVEPSSSIDVLEERVMSFYGLSSLDERPVVIRHAARKATSYESTTMAQCAWLIRARNLARAVSAVPYTERRLQGGINRIRTMLEHIEESRRVPAVLAEAGVRLVLVESLPGSKIDGAVFWLDSKSPVIVLSLRYDRVDNFWFVLFHELMHLFHKDVKHGDEPIIDEDLTGGNSSMEDGSDVEVRASRDAARLLVPEEDIKDFILRVRPLYSKKKIRGFAASIGVHPGIVVGQLQQRDEILYSHSRDMLEKIRETLWDSTLTDGWGLIPQI